MFVYTGVSGLSIKLPPEGTYDSLIAQKSDRGSPKKTFLHLLNLCCPQLKIIVMPTWSFQVGPHTMVGLNHSPIQRHLAFQFLTIMNQVTVNIFIVGFCLNLFVYL